MQKPGWCTAISRFHVKAAAKLPGRPARAPRALRNFMVPTRAPWFLAELERDYPEIAHMRLLGLNRYVLNAPELIVETFTNNAHELIKGPVYDALKPVIGNGL